MNEVLKVTRRIATRNISSSSDGYFVKLPGAIGKQLLPSDQPVCGVQKDTKTWTLICIDRVVARYEGKEQRISLRQMDYYCHLGLAKAKLHLSQGGKKGEPKVIIGSRERLIWVSDPTTMCDLSRVASFLDGPAIRLGLLDFPAAHDRPYDRLPSSEEWATEGGRYQVNHAQILKIAAEIDCNNKDDAE